MESVYDLFTRGTRLLEDGDFHAATVPLARARDLEPEKTSIREALGRALFRSQRYEQAAAGVRGRRRAGADERLRALLPRPVAAAPRPALRGPPPARARLEPAPRARRLPPLPRPGPQARGLTVLAGRATRLRRRTPRRVLSHSCGRFGALTRNPRSAVKLDALNVASERAIRRYSSVSSAHGGKADFGARAPAGDGASDAGADPRRARRGHELSPVELARVARRLARRGELPRPRAGRRRDGRAGADVRAARRDPAPLPARRRRRRCRAASR